MLNILYQFNEKYVPYAGVSITSLLENNKESGDITIYLLGEDISEKSRRKLLDQIEIYGQQGVFIDAGEVIRKMQDLGLNGYRDSYATNIKMFINHYIPEAVKRLLYIDCDTIVTGNLSKLFEMDLKDKPIGMVLDSMCLRHKQAIGFSKKDLYFNGGVILFDTQKWREQRCEERITDHIQNVRAHYMAPDQDILNIVLKGQIKVLDIIYNFQPFHMVYTYEQYMRFFGQPKYYSEKRLKNATDKVAIYHTFRYLGEFPWHKDSLHPATSMFDKYLAKSLWSDYKKTETEKNDLVFCIERSLYRMLPKPVFIVVFKICYEIFMWKSNRDSLKNQNNSRM